MTPLVLADPDRPFWGFAELLLAAAVFVASITSVIFLAGRYLHASESGLWSVIEEGAAYGILFLALKLMFVRYGKGLVDSLAWSTPGPFPPLSLLVTGLSLSFVVFILQYLLRTPDIETPFEKLLADPASRIAVALFGITLGPMVEELLFRGFLQPVLINVAGVFPGILMTSVLFGALHLTQNALLWQSGVLITLVGFVLGTIRHISGSTKASTIAHIGYNCLPVLGLFLQTAPLARR